jgi:uncharacterized protein YhdP
MKKTVLLSLAIIILITITFGAIVIYKRLLYLDAYKDDIVAALQKALQRQVLYENGNLSLGFSPSFTFTKVIVKDKDGFSAFISTDRLSFKIGLLPLLEKKLVLKEVQLENPVIKLNRDNKGVFNFSDILETKKEEVSLHVKSIRIKHGSVTFVDQAVSKQGVTTSLEDLDLYAGRLMRGEDSDFKISTVVAANGRKSSLSLNGTAKLAGKDKPLSDTSLSVKIKAKGLESGHFWDYYSKYVPFRKIIGRLDIESTFKGKLADFSSRGTVKLAGLRFDYPQIFHSPLMPKDLHFTYDMELTPKDLVVKKLNLNVDGLAVKGSCALKDIYSSDLMILAKATTNPFRLEEFGRYIPYGVIPKDVSEFIEKHILGGTYHLQNGRLEGRISQIAYMEKGTNYNVLSIGGTVENGLVSFGTDTPAFNSIKGRLAMRGKDFILSGMEGRFGGSPFKLEGKIADYPLTIPSRYPFIMTMTPGPAEISWLLGQKETGKLGFSGQSTLYLSGNGFTSNYNLNGKWNLTNAAYSYPAIIQKPKGQANNLFFQGSINKEEARLASLQYNLNSLSLNTNGIYHFAGKQRTTFSAATNQFQIQDIAPMIPKIRKYLPTGRIKVTVHGRNETKDLGGLHLNGNILLSGVSLNPSENMKRLSNLTGDIRFTEDSLETSMLAARLGNSAISGSGTLTGFKNPSYNLTFSLPSLDFADLGLRSTKTPTPVNKIHGIISMKDGNLHIKSLSGIINRSNLTMSGNISDIRNPKLDVSVTSPYLELDDMLFFKGLEPEQKKKGAAPHRISGRVAVYADSGKIRQIPFTKLHSVVQFGEKTFYLEPVEFNALGGTLSGRGRIDFGTTGSPRYQAAFDVKNLSAAQLLQAVQTKREMTGALSTQGELSASGESWEDIKRTALGNVKLTCEEGTLRKFSVLSKIFSLLNVSQLLKFQLPDMVLGGMPYNKINATFSLSNGIASTDDLFIDSDAMNISVIGKFNLVKSDLDLTIGVKPLQTVDKIVSKIPIVGWILTGKNRSLVTAYFEAKGNWENPQVRAIPVKALAKGVFGIFKRVFQLPAKLITDTGEVIIGK